MAGRILAEHAEQILALRRRAQDSINELEKIPRGELVIAANEATCIYVLPGVFAELKSSSPTCSCSWIAPTAHASCRLYSTIWPISALPSFPSGEEATDSQNSFR